MLKNKNTNQKQKEQNTNLKLKGAQKGAEHLIIDAKHWLKL